MEPWQFLPRCHLVPYPPPPTWCTVLLQLDWLGASASGQPTWWFKTRLNQNVNTSWGQKAGLSRCLSRSSRVQEPRSGWGLSDSFYTEIWGSLGPLSGASGGAAGRRGDQRPTCPAVACGRCHSGKGCSGGDSICSLPPSLMPPSLSPPSLRVSDRRWHFTRGSSRLRGAQM